ncbi:hypothetical protein [Arthrobacter sp. MDT1-65]
MSNQTKFDQIHSHISGDQQITWMNLLAEKVAKEYLDTPIKRHLDGKVTTPRIEQAWIASNNSAIRGDIAALRELVAQLAGSQGAVIDYDKVGQASAKAIAEYVTIVATTTATLKEQ